MRSSGAMDAGATRCHSSPRRRPVIRDIGRTVLTVALLAAVPVAAQGSRDTLSGAITDTAGGVVPDAAVGIKNVGTGQLTATRTDSAGIYRVPDLAPGTYEVSASADGFSKGVAAVTIVAGTQPVANLQLRRGLSLGDLGFSAAQTQGSAKDQFT